MAVIYRFVMESTTIIDNGKMQIIKNGIGTIEFTLIEQMVLK